MRRHSQPHSFEYGLLIPLLFTALLFTVRLRLPHAQKRFAAVVHSARWLDGFDQASTAHRARMLSQAKPGAMFLYGAVPSRERGALLPVSFMTVV